VLFVIAATHLGGAELILERGHGGSSMIARRFWILALSVAFVPGISQAGLIAPEWYFGKWECLNDGRAGEMEWRAREVSNTNCPTPDVCTSSSSFEIVGSYLFLPNGPVAPLTRVDSNTAMLKMTLADGNAWYLANKGKRAEGWAMLGGEQRPLSCIRKGSGKVKKKLFP
jgi:hypothetical protein